MAKVDLDLVKFILQRNQVDTRLVAQILEDIQQEVEQMQAEEPPAPKVKKQHVIVVSDPQGTLASMDYVGWVAQIPEEDPPQAAVERIHRAAYDFNTSPKGRRMPIQSVGEACEVVAARFFKEHQIWIKTKEPVLVVKTDNKIPLLALRADAKARRESDLAGEE